MQAFAFVFPGQGSQAVGMLDAWGDHPAITSTLAEASAALGEDIGRLIKDGPKEALALTTNTQPVMLVAGVAAYRAWLAEGGAQPAVVAGHSLGEYSALVAAGALTLADAAPLVRFRAQAMQDAVPVGIGAMAAVLGMDAQKVVENAIGGDNVSTVVRGRERYRVNVRYLRDFRSDLGALGRIPVSAGPRRQLPLSDLATINMTNGPAMIRSENGLLTGYVYVDLAGRDPESYVSEAQQLLSERLKLPTGYSIAWSGHYEAMQRVNARLRVVVPITFVLICLLLYTNTGSISKTVIVLLAVPFSAVGAVWFLYLAGYNVSVAVWVGLIALLGIDAETGVFMLLYLDLAYEEVRREGRLGSLNELREAIIHGAAKRLRPKFMTFSVTCVGLVPIMLMTGAGSDVMKRIAAPMIGGIFTSFALELLVYPAIYELWKWPSLRKTVRPIRDSEARDLQPVGDLVGWL